MSIECTEFGKAQDKPIHLYTLENNHGLSMKVMNLGAIITELHVPDHHGHTADVQLGFDRLEPYLADHPCFGAICGRVANRIREGRMTIDGKEYQLDLNRDGVHLHGGYGGFHTRVWEPRIAQSNGEPSVRMMLISEDGDQKYPGKVTAEVVYLLSDDNELIIEMTATTDAPTPVNLAHHSYWNLAGHDAGTIHDHELMLNAKWYTLSDEMQITTGEVALVDNTPYDFRSMKTIGHVIGQTPAEVGGFDDNLIIDGELGAMNRVVELVHRDSGRRMTLHANTPGVQFFTANILDGSYVGKGGTAYQKHAGVCFETQHFPNSVNIPHFPNTILRPGQTYCHKMIHKFDTV